jgi:hypothetical protein
MTDHRFITKEQFEQEIERARTQTEWGRWTFDPDVYATLDIRPYSAGTKYEIRLFKAKCNWSAYLSWLGHWVEHLSGKSWLTDKDLRYFVEAANDLYRSGRGVE